MIPEDTFGFYRCILAGAALILASGCASTPVARNFDGHVIAKGTPVVIRDNSLNEQERIQLARKLGVIGFVAVQNEHGNFPYSVSVRFNKDSSVCVIALQKDGVPLLLAKNVDDWYLGSIDRGRDIAFSSALFVFERGWYDYSSPVAKID